MQKFALDREDLDPVVVLVRHNDPVHAVTGRRGRPFKFALAFAARPEVVQEAAFKVINLDPVVAPVGHQNKAVFGAADAPRPAQLAFAFALAAKDSQRLLDVRVVPADADFDGEGGALNVQIFERDADGVLALDGGFPYDLISPILSVKDAVSDNTAVRASHVDSVMKIRIFHQKPCRLFLAPRKFISDSWRFFYTVNTQNHQESEIYLEGAKKNLPGFMLSTVSDLLQQFVVLVADL